MNPVLLDGSVASPAALNTVGVLHSPSLKSYGLPFAEFLSGDFIRVTQVIEYNLASGAGDTTLRVGMFWQGTNLSLATVPVIVATFGRILVSYTMFADMLGYQESHTGPFIQPVNTLMSLDAGKAIVRVTGNELAIVAGSASGFDPDALVMELSAPSGVTTNLSIAFGQTIVERGTLDLG